MRIRLVCCVRLESKLTELPSFLDSVWKCTLYRAGNRKPW